MISFLKHNSLKTKDLKQDVISGTIVFLLALPLCMAIAMASGFPPLAGIYTAVIGGIVTSLLGGAPLTIKGPAAGMIMVCLGAVTELASTTDTTMGVKRALAVGVIAGAIQMLLGIRKLAALGELIPPTVVHGMMAAIGLTIIVKQFPFLFGLNYTTKGFFNNLQELPTLLEHPNAIIMCIGFSLLGIYIFLNYPKMKKIKIFSIVPAPVVVLSIGLVASLVLHFELAHHISFWGHDYDIGPKYLVNLPSNFFSQMMFPSFDFIGEVVFWKYVFLYTFVGSIESILTVNAMDTLDPWKRVTNLNRDLTATGFANFLVSFVGGLPMISEVVRSKANIDNGGSSAIANMTHAVCLLLMVGLLPGVLSFIPLSVLAAMLIYTGYRLSSPSEMLKVLRIGGDQMLLFALTTVMTLKTDLLIGVFSGIFAKIVIHYVRGVKVKDFMKLGLNKEADEAKKQVHYYPKGSLLFTHFLTLKKSIEFDMDKYDKIFIHCKDLDLIDHTIQEKLHALSTIYHEKIEIVENHELIQFSIHNSYSTKMRKNKQNEVKEEIKKVS